MNHILTGAELARPFLPAKDFDLFKRYEALGFEKVLEGDVAIFRAGSGGACSRREASHAASRSVDRR